MKAMRCSASTRSVVSAQVQKMPATSPASFLTGV